MMGKWFVPSVLGFLLSFDPANAVMVSFDGKIYRDGYPEGTLKVANHFSRTCGLEGPGGGDYLLNFRVIDTAEFNEVLKIYSEIAHPTLELELRTRHNDTPHHGRNPRMVDDWVLGLQKISRDRMIIKLIVFTNGGNIEWEDVSIPDNLIVIDKRAEPVRLKFTLGFTVEESPGSPDPTLLNKGCQIAELTEDNVKFKFEPRGLPSKGYQEGDLVSKKNTIQFRWDAIYRLHKVDEVNQRVFLERIWDEGVMGWVYMDGRVEMADDNPN